MLSNQIILLDMLRDVQNELATLLATSNSVHCKYFLDLENPTPRMNPHPPTLERKLLPPFTVEMEDLVRFPHGFRDKSVVITQVDASDYTHFEHYPSFIPNLIVNRSSARDYLDLVYHKDLRLTCHGAMRPADIIKEITSPIELVPPDVISPFKDPNWVDDTPRFELDIDEAWMDFLGVPIYHPFDELQVDEWRIEDEDDGDTLGWTFTEGEDHCPIDWVTMPVDNVLVDEWRVNDEGDGTVDAWDGKEWTPEEELEDI